MGDKYIIELEDKPFHKEDGDFLYRAKGFNSLVFDWNGLQMLTPYTEPDLDAIRNEAYEKGVQDTKQHWVDAPRTCAYQLGYENGLNDAWEAARKIGYSLKTSIVTEIFGTPYSSQIFSDTSAAEAIAKIRQYEQEKEQKIKVGDEVNAPCGKAVVTGMENDSARYVYSSGEYGFMEKSNLTRTGRHFPEIAAVLQKMKGV